MKQTLYEKLNALANTNEYAFHMPGHKRNPEISIFEDEMRIDITEIEGFDNLHHAEGILKEEQEFAANLYGTKKTLFLINGSTSGVLASICAATKDGDSFVMARNSHRSAYNAVCLKGLQVQYVYPGKFAENDSILGEINPEDVARAMDACGAKVVFITSPTYEGVVSDIARIAKEVHKREGLLIVDEAHGAHLGFHKAFPKSAITEGADLVIQSMHKTLPSLTQTALLHVCSSRIAVEKVMSQLSVFQTSSPSYVLMNSISRCLHFLQEEGELTFSSYVKNLTDFYNKIKRLEKLSVIKAKDSEFDFGKINICAKNLIDEKGTLYGGKELAKDLLQKYGLQMEMVNADYVLAMTSICDTQEGFDRLADALLEIDKKLVKKEFGKSAVLSVPAQAAMTLKTAVGAEKEKCVRSDWEGKISGEYIYLYPPGSPILTPGEIISKEIYEQILDYIEQGLNVQGPADYTLETLWIVKN